MGKTRWIIRWKNSLKPSRLPGVWLREKGGCLVRARVLDPTTRCQKEIRKVLPNYQEAEAFAWLEKEKARVRAGLVLGPQQKRHFGDYAVSVWETKIAMGELSTITSQERWKHTLEHLIGGTSSDDGEIRVGGFGEMLVDQIRASHVEAWKGGIARLIHSGAYKPATANGWLAVLRSVMKAAKRDFDLAGVATDGVREFDTSTHATYTEEEPNSLAAEQVSVFLELLKQRFPQHYAMAYLGFATGLRPSSLRPLRRAGSTGDVDWENKRLLVRRSQTRGDEVRDATKQGTRYSIALPADVFEVLRWHVETQLLASAQVDSDLLFPSASGGFRAGSVLNKPFDAVSDAMGLGYRFTARGMRRTFNDLARAAQVENLVTRSISGHATESMQHHYSTVRGDEQRQGIAKVIHLMTAKADRSGVVSSEYHSVPKAPPKSVPEAIPSGTPSGTPKAPSGTPNQKAS